VARRWFKSAVSPLSPFCGSLCNRRHSSSVVP
jgi:hypothetical protein